MKKILRATGILLCLFLSACQTGHSGMTSRDTLRIALSQPYDDLSPLSAELKNRMVYSQWYEPLIRLDENFNFETALALTWGRIDDTTWEFRLRQKVHFHDGSDFDAADVLYSIKLAKQLDSGLAELLKPIKTLEVIDPYRIRLSTEKPDPLLLNRLTQVSILPEGFVDFETPIGTGAYQFISADQNRVELLRFEGYWGPQAYFEHANLEFMESPLLRFENYESDQVQFVVDVPLEYKSEFPAKEIKNFPGLEVDFLMMNARGVLGDERLREAIWYALRKDFTMSLNPNVLSPTNSYAATGIFGHNPLVPHRFQDVDRARELRTLLPKNLSLTLDIPLGLEPLGEAIQEDLKAMDIEVRVLALPPDRYKEKILAGASELYFFGWKYDIADLSEFFESVVLTEAPYNTMSYSNVEIDELLKGARETTDESKRRALLDRVSEKIAGDYQIIPLFESRKLYAVKPHILWNLRLDGQVWAFDVFGQASK